MIGRGGPSLLEAEVSLGKIPSVHSSAWRLRERVHPATGRRGGRLSASCLRTSGIARPRKLNGGVSPMRSPSAAGRCRCGPASPPPWPTCVWPNARSGPANRGACPPATISCCCWSAGSTRRRWTCWFAPCVTMLRGRACTDGTGVASLRMGPAVRRRASLPKAGMTGTADGCLTGPGPRPTIRSTDRAPEAVHEASDEPARRLVRRSPSRRRQTADHASRGMTRRREPGNHERMMRK